MLHLQIITPEKAVYDDEVDQVSLPTQSGQITVLPHHANLITTVETGELTFKKHSKDTTLACGFGFAQVTKDNVKVLVDLAAIDSDIDERAIEAAKKEAEEALAKKHELSEEEYATAAANLQKALTQLKVKRRHRRV